MREKGPRAELRQCHVTRTEPVPVSGSGEDRPGPMQVTGDWESRD